MGEVESIFSRHAVSLPDRLSSCYMHGEGICQSSQGLTTLPRENLHFLLRTYQSSPSAVFRVAMPAPEKLLQKEILKEIKHDAPLVQRRKHGGFQCR